MLYFPKPKAEGSKNEIIHSFVLEKHLMTDYTCCTQLLESISKKQFYHWTIFESYCSKQSNIFVKINVHPMHHSKVTSNIGPRVHGNSPTSSSQHFLSHFCCCLGEMLKSTTLPLLLKPWCQHYPTLCTDSAQPSRLRAILAPF